MDNEEKDQILQEAYYDPAQGLISARRLYQKVKQEGIRYKDVEAFVKNQTVHQEHQQTPIKIYYPIYSVIDGSYQADLMFYPKLKHINRGYDTILSCMEITTRKGYCIAMQRII